MVPVASAASWTTRSMPRASPNDLALGAKFRRQLRGNLPPRRRSVARTDNCNGRAGGQGPIPHDGQKRWRSGYAAQQGGIIFVPKGDQPGAKAVDPVHFPLRGLSGVDVQAAFTAATPGELRQGRQRRARAAIAGHQITEEAGADIFAADQAQPVQPLLVGHDMGTRKGHPSPIRLSSPLNSRLILAAWAEKISTPIMIAVSISWNSPLKAMKPGVVRVAVRAASDE